ncbi:MAG TPA: hypothetical protein VHO02_00590, partial [Fibrobacteria bacterium]|nr:hypothetical protein [Fibrobacteria bacterium]
KFWPLGGDIMAQVDLSVFAQSYKIIALIDSDPKSASIRRQFEALCQSHGIPCHKLQRYAVENYFSISALKKVFGSQFPDGVSEINSGKKLVDQIGIDVKKNNRKIAKAMSFNDIRDTDFEEFLLKVRRMLS